MDDSPLGRLPGELRNKIYEYALRENDGFVSLQIFALPSVPFETRLLFQKNNPFRKSAHNGLPSTCREIRQESRAIYFAVNTFEVTMDGGHDGDRLLVNALGADMMQHITDLKLDSPRLEVKLYNSGHIGHKKICEAFFPTLRMLQNSLGCRSAITCNMVIKEYPEWQALRYYNEACINMSTVNTALHSLREALRPIREQRNIDEENELFAASFANLENVMRA